MHFGGLTLPVGFTIGFPVRNPVVFQVVFLVRHKHSECPIHLIAKKLIIQTIYNIFANLNQKVYHLQPARMAESVDALVSNTSGAIRAGSIPAPGTRKWPTDTCRPFLYKIFPTFSPHLPIILQKVFRKRPILLSKSADVIRYRFLFHRLFLSAAEFICKAESNELGD